MSNISKAFEKSKAFIGFVTAGDPDLETSKEVMIQMARGGCDLIEIGIPFSDPIAEGPVIQEADLRSLQAGTTTDKVIDLAAEVSKEIDVPLVFMTYLNVLFKYGYDKFLKEQAKAVSPALSFPICRMRKRKNSAVLRINTALTLSLL